MGILSTKDLMKNPAWRKAMLEQGGTPAPVQPRRPPAGPAMNGTERQYADRLRTLVAAGEVRWWAFNAVRLRITSGQKAAWFRPDFFIEFADGHFEFHETKGFERPAAMLRLKVAAGLFPVRFVLVKRDGDQWSYEVFGGAQQ